MNKIVQLLCVGFLLSSCISDANDLYSIHKVFLDDVPGVSSVGLVAYYPFNGNAKDESKNGNDGTLYGATFSTDRKGNANSACYFRGINYKDYILIKNSSRLNLTDGFTFSCWLKLNNTNAINSSGMVVDGGSQAIFAKDFDNPSGIINGVVSGSTTNNSFTAWHSGNPAFNTINIIPTENWLHVVFVYDFKNKTQTISINGDIKTQSNQNFNVDSSNLKDLYLGKFNTTSAFHYSLNGYLDEVRIYNRSLSYDEINALYKFEK